MFRTLLLTTFAGIGAANPSPEYGKSNRPTYCSDATKKCFQARELRAASAYCSQQLRIPKVTKTVTRAVCATTTVTSTRTKNGSGGTVTSTISSCALPTPTELPEEGGDAAAPAPEGKRSAASKPACLSRYNKPASITSACKCLSVKKATKTVTTTKTTKTSTKTVKTTVDAGTPTTVYVLPTNTEIALLDDEVRFLVPEGRQKGDESGMRLTGLQFQSNMDLDDALLFSLNAGDGTLTVADNSAATEDNPIEVGDVIVQLTQSTTEDSQFRVQARSPSEVSTGDFQPITCSVSVASDLTCPLDCQRSAPNDANQLEARSSGDWFLGPPGSISPSSFQTFVRFNTRGTRGKKGRRDRGRIWSTSAREAMED